MIGTGLRATPTAEWSKSPMAWLSTLPSSRCSGQMLAHWPLLCPPRYGSPVPWRRREGRLVAGLYYWW